MQGALTLDVWREVGRHLELPELVDRVFPQLARALPLSSMLVRRVDAGTTSVETLASIASTRSERGAARTDSNPAQVERLARWCRSGTAAHGRDAVAAGGLSAFVPGSLELDDVSLVPLRPDPAEHDAPAGVLIAGLVRGGALSASQRTLLEGLGEPFAAALANDCRIRELRRLREAVEAENRALLRRLGRPGVDDVIVGADSGLRAVMERAALVARSDAPVLILGETGTGKEVVARAIHTRSPRASGPLIRVNCGAIPPELVDSELFGHERGSFTGASATRQGWFERADGGTLFLDEIGELPLAAQVRLLRILQDGSFERVGGQSSLNVDVRLVAATHRDLPSMVRERSFREDLWYRICVFPIHLPPLRDRAEDIAPLARHFAQKAARRLGLAPALPAADDLELLAGYAWPGNVRELASVIERAAILGDGKRLEIAKALGSAAVHPAPADTAVEYASAAEAPDVAPSRRREAADESLNAAMSRHIEAALRACHGRIEGPFGAALKLGIKPQTLRARMRKLGVDWRRYRVRNGPPDPR